MGVVLRFPCPSCRRWVPFERATVKYGCEHEHEFAVCPYCSYGFPYARLTEAIASLGWAWTGPISLSNN